VLSKKKVIETMRKDPLDKIDSKLTVTAAAIIMRQRSRSILIVVEDGKPIGIVTETDLVRRVIAENLVPAQIKVREIMSTPLVTIDSKCTVLDAAKKIQKYGIRGLPVIDNDKIVGMFTVTDIAIAVASDSERDESLVKAVMRSSYANY
jgi:CBS domain-containing protein